MFPTDPRQMQQLMRQMGIKSRMLDAKKVIIDCGETSIIIEPAQVMEMDVKGEKNYNISGKAREEAAISEEDISLIMDGAGASREDAISALKEKGDVASAIIYLKGE